MHAGARINAIPLLLVTIIWIGCGGNATPAATNPAPTTPSATPTPSPSPTPTPPPATSGATTQFQVTLSAADNKTHGNLTVDTAGDVHVTLTSAAPGTYNLTFTTWNSDGWTTPPMTIGTLIVDASGNASATIHFPQAGIWVGDFSVNNSSNAYFNNWAGGSLASYQSMMEPAKAANAGRGSQRNSTSVPQDPLSGGSVTIANGHVQVSITGAVPNVQYFVGTCGQQCYAGTPFTTDANGNGSVSFTLNAAPGGDIFDVYRIVNNTAGAVSGFDGGFKVP